MITTASPRPRRFGPLRDKHSRPYLMTAGLSMMGDNIEHVITYWVLWQTFHSPWLVGFQVISHWLPFLLLSVLFGGLAEKYDCRRIIQIAQGLFAFVSLGWGVLFLDRQPGDVERLRAAGAARLRRRPVGTGGAAHAPRLRRAARAAQRGAPERDVQEPRRAGRAGGRLRAAPAARAHVGDLRQHRPSTCR